MSLLRRAFLLDFAATLAMGLLLAAAAPQLSPLLGLPLLLLRTVGVALLPFAGLLWLAPRRRALAWALVAANAVYVADSLLLLATGWVQPTALGTAFVVAQAAAVALFTVLEYRALRGSVVLA